MVTATASYAFDKKSARSFDADGRMRVRDCVISVAEINPYYGKEIPRSRDLGLADNTVYDLFRDPDELARGADSFNGLPLMIRHIAQTADEPRKEYIGGSVFNARFEDGKLRADLLVMDKQAIEYIQSGELADLSSSYRYTPDMTAGECDGRPYHGVMRAIEGNHVALVEDGRATGAHVADSALSSQPGANTVTEPTNGGNAEIAQALGLLAEQLAELKTEVAGIRSGAQVHAADADPDKDDDKANDADPDEDDGKANDADPDKDDDDDKKAMDAKSVQALVDAAVKSERERAKAVEQAKRDTRADLGDMIAMDSADEIYMAALKQRGVDITAIPAGTAHLAYQAINAAARPTPTVRANDSRANAADGKPRFDTSRIAVRDHG